MKKRGSAKLVGEHTIEIIVAVLCVLILAGLFVKLYLSWGNGYEEVLEKIDEKITYLKSSSYTLDYLYVTFYLPKKAAKKDILYLKNYKEGFFPDEQCVGLWESCLCVCNDQECSGAKKCKGFKDEIKIINMPEITTETKFIEGTNQDGKNCRCAYNNYISLWQCSGNCDCLDVYSDDKISKIVEKMSGCFDSIFTQESYSGTFESSKNYFDVMDIPQLGREIKITKKGEIIEISKSDRQNGA